MLNAWGCAVSQNQPKSAKLISQHFTMQMDNDPKHAEKNSPRVSRGKEAGYSSAAKSVNPSEHCRETH